MFEHYLIEITKGENLAQLNRFLSVRKYLQAMPQLKPL